MRYSDIYSLGVIIPKLSTRLKITTILNKCDLQEEFNVKFLTVRVWMKISQRTINNLVYSSQRFNQQTRCVFSKVILK